jgi:hypothetical protein
MGVYDLSGAPEGPIPGGEKRRGGPFIAGELRPLLASAMGGNTGSVGWPTGVRPRGISPGLSQEGVLAPTPLSGPGP